MKQTLTKIVATLGPTTGTLKSVRALAKAGVNVFRLNMSHGDPATLSDWIRNIRTVERERGCFLGILLDLQGPKIRVGRLGPEGMRLSKGATVVFSTHKKPAPGIIPVQFAKFHKSVTPGDRVYLNDGQFCVRVEAVNGREVTAQVLNGGLLTDFKGINLPDAKLSESPLTPKDRKDLAFGLEQKVDFVALSFVGRAADIIQLRKLIHAQGGEVDIVAKIERRQAVENIESIVEVSDVVMVARGDLGIEIPLAEVPVVQRKILTVCARQSRPVIIATQMLESMIENSRPTRAEASDVANSVFYKADAVMLSGETAAGKHPVAAVKVMVETLKEAESYLIETESNGGATRESVSDFPVNKGVALTAVRMSGWMNACAIVVFTQSGGTAKMVSSFHPMVPMFAFTARQSPGAQAGVDTRRVSCLGRQ